ncbi:Endoribonuclease dcr-1 [Portunus trituberculatus]|uniref:Endoribonuclease dcr-1 n=1 Tax=Portunus trituberculatus TaxID=210409 RepID=A0A5B7DRL9_PORTR|nr:Endoribonuclease dcr-1 [Portunus trituberculatus]
MFERSRGVDIWTDEDWKEQLNKNEVLVIVAQIFLDLILHSQMSLADVNLLILDECHHATGNHPMREIMRRYESLKAHKPELCPRVLGLTACVIHKKCKFDDVRNQIRELEKTMFSALTTSVDAQAVKKHTTAAKEVVICFSPNEVSKYAENVQSQLIGIKSDIDEMENIDGKQKKVLKKKLDNISEIMDHLGDWSGARAVKYEMDNFEETEDFEEIPAVRDLKKLLCQRLELIYNYCCNEEKKMFQPLNHTSEKVKRLCDILSVCRSDVCGLIFVERRNTAKLLYDFLLEAAKIYKELSFIKPAYVISANSRYSTDINLLKNELKKQKETLLAFARGENNFLISTSVLEEGLDVRKCNAVIRFDKAMNFRSYVQSRGRARAIPAKYILMIEESDVDDLLSSVRLYREIETVLTNICINRELPTDLETSLHFAEDEIMPPYEPFGTDGPRITFNSAICLINVYCGKLPQDKFTELVPETVYETSSEDEENRIIAGIKLPINACLKETIYGSCMKNKDHAKKSAALALCKRLHEMKELDDRLRPVGKSEKDMLNGLIELPPEEPTERGMPQPGTKKRRQIYNREMCQAFSVSKKRFKLYEIIVKSKPFNSNQVTIDSKDMNMSVGFLCKETLRLPPFPLYSPKWNEVIVKIQLISESMDLDPITVNYVEHFHKVVFETLLDINPNLFDYFPQKTSLLILPLVGGLIDTLLLSDIASRETLRTFEAVNPPNRLFNFERSDFEDAIIYPLYLTASDEPMYYVTEIEDQMSPQDKFPDNYYSSYEDYFCSRYNLKISNKYQPLLTVKHLPKDLNNLKMIVQRGKGKKKGQEPPKFMPELCGILPLKASLWWQIMMIPSVLHRLNSLCLAEEMSNMMTSPDSPVIPRWQCNKTDNMDFDWLAKFIKEIVQHPGDNVSVILANAKPKPIQPFMILNSLILQGSNDNFDLERLEVLGDSFIKYAVAEYLFLKYPLEHEGTLSQQRSRFISNKTLYSLGKLKNIPEKIQSIILNPKINGILPGFVLKPEIELHLQNIKAPSDTWAKYANVTEEQFKEEIKKMEDGGRKSCYNPWTQHEVSDKSVADSVEALIGISLLVGGRETAMNFLGNLGMEIYNGTSFQCSLPVPSALLSKEEWANEEVLRYYDKYCLDRLEEKIQYTFRDKSFIVQATTHSSFCQNKVTDCYQRLEFLGDAILDYLVTGMVFSSHVHCTPGQMSDLRSYYDVEVPKALGDLIEAIIGAVYLDSGKSLQRAWDVVQVLMGDIIEETMKKKDIPMNCVRKLYEMVPTGIRFDKLPFQEDDGKAMYKLEIPGLPPLIRSGKNYDVAKIVAAKAGLRLLKEKEERGF